MRDVKNVDKIESLRAESAKLKIAVKSGRGGSHKIKLIRREIARIMTSHKLNCGGKI